ncbi:hypothetical protein DRE_04026 [Drechslerella stenobrocha 248]|uniref:Uncharacterized protein n=1 Tax=Drechslerella stenobrocha 248 TaxID=1043628 RepID=W7HRU4_9PEZI|nr:hypothetical protein DRE_04026 [Drechslerella stenobrocha 248]
MLSLLSTSRGVFFVLANTLLNLSLSVHSFPLAAIYNEYTRAPPPAPRVNHLEIRTAGPTQAGIITHPPARQVILKAGNLEPEFLPQSGRWTRGGHSQNTYTALDDFLASNNNLTSYYYTLSILGLGLHEHPDGLWNFYLHVDLAVESRKEALGHTKLPQLTASFQQPHPYEAGSFIIGDLMDIYELTETDILETIMTDEPALGVMRFLSSRVTKMPGFSHKHVGVEEFELLYPRTTNSRAAGHK